MLYFHIIYYNINNFCDNYKHKCKYLYTYSITFLWYYQRHLCEQVLALIRLSTPPIQSQVFDMSGLAPEWDAILPANTTDYLNPIRGAHAMYG